MYFRLFVILNRNCQILFQSDPIGKVKFKHNRINIHRAVIEIADLDVYENFKETILNLQLLKSTK
jgi:hypothetical protein